MQPQRAVIRVSAALLASLLFAALSGYSASAAPKSASAISPDAQGQVGSVLEQWGYSPAEIAVMVQDPNLVAAVPVRIVSKSTSRTISGTEPTIPGVLSAQTAALGVTPMNVGSSCTGSEGYHGVARTAVNMYGNALYKYDTTTHYCYNGSSVTYAYTVDSASITTLGKAGGWKYAGYSSFAEGYGIWNGHSNGKVTTTLQGRFDLDILKYGYLGSHYENRKIEVHYNGTSTSTESNTGIA